MRCFIYDKKLKSVTAENEEYGASGRMTRLRLALRAVAYATLSSLVLAVISQTMKQHYCCY
jgi:hypothetical protein